MRLRAAAAFAGPLAVLCALAGCGGDDPAGVPVTLTFDGRVGAETFECGGSYDGIGTTGTTLETRDFRFYVHDVRLVRADGTEVPVALEQDGMFQVDDVALLDFEDGSGRCEGGNPQLSDRIVGTVPEGEYTGVRFVLGVPFDLNHADHVIAPPPLNITSMFWDWNGGYKFLRFDGATTGQPDGMRFHLGSTGCEADADGNVTSCADPNRAEVALDGFDPDTSVIVADLAALFEGADLDANTVDTPPGCMGAPIDPDCAPYFDNLGLPFGGSAGGDQRFFTVE